MGQPLEEAKKKEGLPGKKAFPKMINALGAKRRLLLVSKGLRQ